MAHRSPAYLAQVVLVETWYFPHWRHLDDTWTGSWHCTGQSLQGRGGAKERRTWWMGNSGSMGWTQCLPPVDPGPQSVNVTPLGRGPLWRSSIKGLQARLSSELSSSTASFRKTGDTGHRRELWGSQRQGLRDEPGAPPGCRDLCCWKRQQGFSNTHGMCSAPGTVALSLWPAGPRE